MRTVRAHVRSKRTHPGLTDPILGLRVTEACTKASQVWHELQLKDWKGQTTGCAPNQRCNFQHGLVPMRLMGSGRDRREWRRGEARLQSMAYSTRFCRCGMICVGCGCIFGVVQCDFGMVWWNCMVWCTAPSRSTPHQIYASQDCPAPMRSCQSAIVCSLGLRRVERLEEDFAVVGRLKQTGRAWRRYVEIGRGMQTDAGNLVLPSIVKFELWLGRKCGCT